jgi:hypothetical protein
MKLPCALVVVGLGLGGCGRVGFDSDLVGPPGGGADGDARAASSGGGGSSSGGDSAIVEGDGSTDATMAGDGLTTVPDAPSSDGVAPEAALPDASFSCRAGCTCEWYLGHRYMLCPDKILYTAARDTCRSYGIRLVRLTSGPESSFLRLRSQQDSYPKFHIGASDALQEGTWLWDDGTQFWSGAAAGTVVGGNFAFWASGEPNNQGGDENCGELQGIQGWNDSVCDSEAKPFICKQYPDPLPQCGDSVVQPGEACDDGKATATCDADCSAVVCGDGVVNGAAGEVCDDGATGQYCNATCTQFVCPPGCQCFGTDFALCTAPATFGDAEVACGRHGMALASVVNATEDQAIRAQATGAGVTDYWLGGADLDSEGNWMWMDTTRFWSGTASGTALAYAHFAATAPGGGTALDCLHVGPDGTWTDAACTTTYPYVCKRVSP